MGGRRFDVYGIGNAIMDLQLKVQDSDLERLLLEKGAMRLVSREEQVAILSFCRDRSPNKTSGGSAANTMIAVSQLGGRTAYGCLVGDDDFGTQYLLEMSQIGVEVATDARCHGSTATSVILVTDDAERTMNTYLGVSAEFGEAQVSEEFIKSSEWLYIEGYLFSTDLGRRAVDRALAIASRHKTRVAVTFSDRFIVSAFRDALNRAVAGAELVFANSTEAVAFTNAESTEAALQSLKGVVPNVVITRGEAGALVSFDGVDYDIPAVKVKAVDDTGAGDMFAGGFLYGISHGLSGAQSAKLGCFLAARVVGQLGPRLSGDLRYAPGIEELLVS